MMILNMGIEIIITLASFLVTSVMKIFAAKSANQTRIMESALKNASAVREDRGAINALDSRKNFAFVRRVIALSVIGSVVVLPLLAPLLLSILGFAPIAIQSCTPDGDTTSFVWGLISWDADDMNCLNHEGIIIMPWHSQLVAVIVGAYFGDKVNN